MSKLLVTAESGDVVNLRKSTSKSSSIIAQIKIKSEVELIERTSDIWYKVKYGNNEGYMMAKYLKPITKSNINKEDLRAIYNSLKDTLALIEKILK